MTSAMRRITMSTTHSVKDIETANAAMQSAWIFLLRSSEYCYVDGGTRDYCPRLGDVAFYDGGKRGPSFREAQTAATIGKCNETMPFVIRGSKSRRRRTRHGRDAHGDPTARDWRLTRSKHWLTCSTHEVTSG